jgi:hypothetical protein
LLICMAPAWMVLYEHHIVYGQRRGHLEAAHPARWIEPELETTCQCRCIGAAGFHDEMNNNHVRIFGHVPLNVGESALASSRAKCGRTTRTAKALLPGTS